MDWKTIKLLGGVGSILAVVPYVNLAGWVLVIISLYGMSQQTGNKNIFNYYLFSVIFKFVSVLLFIFGFFSIALITAAFRANGESNYVGLILAVIVFIGILIVAAYFLKKSFIEVSKETGIDSFKTAGNLIFWGAVTTVVGVGIVLYFIGYIMEIISFFSLPDDFIPEKPDANFKEEILKKEN